MHQMTGFDGERFMIYVRLLAARKNFFHDNRVAKSDVTKQRTFFSDLPGTIGLFTERKACWEKGNISRFRHNAASNFARFYRGLFLQ